MPVAFQEPRIKPHESKEIELDYYEGKGKFREVLADFERRGLELITAKRYAELVMKEGKGSPLLSNSTFILSEGCIVLQDGDALVTLPKYNPVLKYDEEIPRSILGDLKKRAQRDPIQALRSGVLYFPHESCGWHGTSENGQHKRLFAKSPLSLFLFREAAEPFTKFLQDYTRTQVICLTPGSTSDRVKAMAPYTDGLGIYWYDEVPHILSADPDNRDRNPDGGPLKSVFYGVPKQKTRR